MWFSVLLLVSSIQSRVLRPFVRAYTLTRPSVCNPLSVVADKSFLKLRDSAIMVHAHGLECGGQLFDMSRGL